MIPVITGGGSVLVVGLGRSGISAANLLARAGCRVEVSERSRREEAGEDLSILEPSVAVHWGGHPWNLFEGRDLVIVSPGVPSDIAPLVQSSNAGIPVIGEMELAFRMTSMPWAAVTGSNGKSTTVTLLDHMAKEGGLKVATGGNLGTPVSSFAEHPEGLRFILAEVSSFQLETVQTFRPKVAALLNVSPDHLDRYRTMEDYVAAKAAVFTRMKGEDWAVYNADDRGTVDVLNGIEAALFPFSRHCVQDRGAYLDEGWITVRDGGKAQRILERKDFPLPGVHNLENALAAVAVGTKMGIAPSAMRATLKTFRGLEHRMELVGYFRGVAIYNDSKGTNVGATLRSLESLGGQVILILGGKDKGAPYDPLLEPVRRKVSHLILLGEAADRMQKAFEGAARIIRVGSVGEAVREAIHMARPGSEILFSPACSSYDMFTGYEERGRVFKDAVRKFLGMLP